MVEMTIRKVARTDKRHIERNEVNSKYLISFIIGLDFSTLVKMTDWTARRQIKCRHIERNEVKSKYLTSFIIGLDFSTLVEMTDWTARRQIKIVILSETK